MEQQPLGRSIKALSNEITRFVSDSINLDKENRYTTIQFLFLDYIGRFSVTRPVFQRDLEGQFNIRRSTATGILQGLEKNKLISRQTSLTDARLKEITFTTMGQALFETHKISLKTINQTLSAGISEKDLSIFQSVLTQIYENISSNETKIEN